jgi:hypothetical protein
MNNEQIINLRNQIMDCLTYDEEMAEGGFDEVVGRRIDTVLKSSFLDKITAGYNYNKNKTTETFKADNYFAIESNTGAVTGLWESQQMCEESVTSLKKKYKGSDWRISYNYTGNLNEKVFIQDLEMIEKLESVYCNKPLSSFKFNDLFGKTPKVDEKYRNLYFKQIIDRQLSKYNLETYCAENKSDTLILETNKGKISMQLTQDSQPVWYLWMRLTVFSDNSKVPSDGEVCMKEELFDYAIRNWLPRLT